MKKFTHIFLLVLLLIALIPLAIILVPFIFIYAIYDRHLDYKALKNGYTKKVKLKVKSVNNWANDYKQK